MNLDQVSVGIDDGLNETPMVRAEGLNIAGPRYGHAMEGRRSDQETVACTAASYEEVAARRLGEKHQNGHSNPAVNCHAEPTGNRLPGVDEPLYLPARGPVETQIDEPTQQLVASCLEVFSKSIEEVLIIRVRQVGRPGGTGAGVMLSKLAKARKSSRDSSNLSFGKRETRCHNDRENKEEPEHTSSRMV
ncbi:MAG: hypothetical protein ACRDHF_11855 [Tepidiformaceae bacterium]